MKKDYVILIISFLIISSSLHAQKWTTYDYNTSNFALTSSYCLATDASGNIWIGTDKSVVKYNQLNTWTVYNSTNTNNGLPNDKVLDLLVTGTNSLMVCTYGNGFIYYNGVSLWVPKNPTTTSNGIPTSYTYCIAQDNPGNFYVGIYSGNSSNAGLVKWDGASTWTPYTFTDTYNYKNVEAIVKDNAGNIWCGTSIGVYKYNPTNSSWTAYTKENTSGGLCGNWVRSIGVDPSGNVWFGCLDKDPATGYWVEGGLSKFTGSTWSNYKPSSGGLTNGYVSAIAFRGSDVWVGTGFCGQYNGHGLYKLSGTTWTNYNIDNNTFPGNCVNDLVVDKNNNLWIAGNNILTKLDFNPTDVKETENVPTSFSLYQNYPNPFNPETIINYQLPVSSFVTLKVYDALGRQVATLVNEFQTAGIHHSTFSTLNSILTSGIYFYKLQSGSFVDVKKMLLVK